jgi:flavin reductase (DIM6/NTAB) family NADH-FMN oxidoreductase RutF
MKALDPYRYLWPAMDVKSSASWKVVDGQQSHMMHMPEDPVNLRTDSRWPAFFPAPICLVTASDGKRASVEKVVGASIVNRFPYVVALSFCRWPLSSRHYPRREFMEILEGGACVAIQYLPLGPKLNAVMRTIADIPDQACTKRLAATGLTTRPAATNGAPVFRDAYMVYEARLADPGRDFGGESIYERPWLDVGSHRVYFLEITAIQLRNDIAHGRSQIHWRSLPAWKPKFAVTVNDRASDAARLGGYTKGYTPDYAFPAAGTIGFESDEVIDGMAVKHLPPLPEHQVEVDNDRARWPCFFPSSAALITTWTEDGLPNVMPCGSTTVISRDPMVITPCVSYAAINQRYAPRASLSLIRLRGRFGCGVPFIHSAVINAIKYVGNVSIAVDRYKTDHAGLEVRAHEWAPVLRAVPIHFDCEVIGEVRLGTHIMFLGEVRRIEVRDDLSPSNPLEWYPWADVREVDDMASAYPASYISKSFGTK